MRVEHRVPRRLGIALEPAGLERRVGRRRSEAGVVDEDRRRAERAPRRRRPRRRRPRGSVASTTCVETRRAVVDERLQRGAARPPRGRTAATDAPAADSARAYWLPSRPSPPVTMATWPSSRNRSFDEVVERHETGYRPVTYRNGRECPVNEVGEDAGNCAGDHVHRLNDRLVHELNESILPVFQIGVKAIGPATARHSPSLRDRRCCSRTAPPSAYAATRSPYKLGLVRIGQQRGAEQVNRAVEDPRFRHVLAPHRPALHRPVADQQPGPPIARRSSPRASG